MLVHVRFSFDRTPLQRMHAALAEAARSGDGAFKLLPVRIPCCAQVSKLGV